MLASVDGSGQLSDVWQYLEFPTDEMLTGLTRRFW
jgi:hypothetical protein